MPPAEVDYLRVALEAARWIRSHEIRSAEGKAWPADPLDTGTVATNLYTGTPGVVLFLLEAHAATGETSYLEDARAGADWLMAALPEPGDDADTGLYTGVAGIGYTLAQTWEATGDERYREGAYRTLEILESRARRVGQGVEWGEVTDIISGTAGTGLYLLWAGEALDAPRATELAVAAGHRLVELAEPADTGLRWPMAPGYERNMPNFSHGTAGVAYFLARLSGASDDPRFLDAAVQGGRYLQSIADVDGETCLIFHHEPGGQELFYLGWCHGPAGTARTFWTLWWATGDEEWRDWVDRMAGGILESGIPERRTPGFWNNVGQCCGNAGVAEFFLALYRETGRTDYLEQARRSADDIVARATRTDDGLMWVQAEHRVRPEFLVAQTGYMQGAAGIGVLMLHLDAEARGERGLVRLPDSPF